MQRQIVHGRKLPSRGIRRQALAGVNGLIESSTRIRLRDGEHAMRHAIGEYSRDVISDHQSILRGWQPAHLHGAG